MADTTLFAAGVGVVDGVVETGVVVVVAVEVGIELSGSEVAVVLLAKNLDFASASILGTSFIFSLILASIAAFCLALFSCIF